MEPVGMVSYMQITLRNSSDYGLLAVNTSVF